MKLFLRCESAGGVSVWEREGCASPHGPTAMLSMDQIEALFGLTLWGEPVGSVHELEVTARLRAPSVSEDAEDARKEEDNG